MPIFQSTRSRSRNRSQLDPSPLPSRDGLVLDWSIPSAGQIPESASNLDTWTAQYGENLMGDDDSAGFGFISGSSMDGESSVRKNTRIGVDDPGFTTVQHAGGYLLKSYPNLRLETIKAPCLSPASSGFELSPLTSSTPSLSSSIPTTSDDDSLDLHWRSLELAQMRWRGMKDVVDECNEFLTFLTLSPTEPSIPEAGESRNSLLTFLAGDNVLDSPGAVDSEVADNTGSEHKTSSQTQTTRRVPPLKVSTTTTMAPMPHTSMAADTILSSEDPSPASVTASNTSATWSILDLYDDDSSPTYSIVQKVPGDFSLQSADTSPQSSANHSLRKCFSISSIPGFASDVPFPDAATLAQRNRKSSAPPLNSVPRTETKAMSTMSFTSQSNSLSSPTYVRPRDSPALPRNEASLNSAAAKPVVDDSSFRSTLFNPLLHDVATLPRRLSGRNRSMSVGHKPSFPEKLSRRIDSLTGNERPRTYSHANATISTQRHQNSSSRTRRPNLLRKSSPKLVVPSEEGYKGLVRAPADAVSRPSPSQTSPLHLNPSHTPGSYSRNDLFSTPSLHTPENSSPMPNSATVSMRSSVLVSGPRDTRIVDDVPFPHPSVLARRIRSPSAPSVSDAFAPSPSLTDKPSLVISSLSSVPPHAPVASGPRTSETSLSSASLKRSITSPTRGRTHSSTDCMSGTSSRGAISTFPYTRASVSTNMVGVL